MNPLNSPLIQDADDRSASRRRLLFWGGIGLVAFVAVVVVWKFQSSDGGAAAASGTAGGSARAGRGADAARPVSVAAMPVTAQALDHTLTALGTVTARATVTVKVLVDGQLVRVAFTEGQMVQAGDVLAQVDPRPFEAALANAKAALQRDDAQLQDAILDQNRYRNLSAEDSIPKQQLDTQDALVGQLKGTVAADRAQIDTAQLNLTYSHVTAPVSGRVGLRQVDVGNVVHAADTTGLAVITEVQPIDIVFPIPQDALPDVLRRLRAGAQLKVDAYDRDGHTLLGSGHLASVDNLIDTTTGTVKLKAAFPNRDLALFPNQFVNVQLHLETIPGALAIPTAAVQRGAPGYYVYLVQADGTVTMRAPKLGITQGDLVQVLDGLALNDKVVVDGTDKLREGSKVEVIDPAARAAAAAPAKASGEHAHKQHAASAGDAQDFQKKKSGDAGAPGPGAASAPTPQR